MKSQTPRNSIARRSTTLAAILFVAPILLCIVAGLSLPAQAQQKVLVYTRNYTPDGKGYVHDNIAVQRGRNQENGCGKRIRQLTSQTIPPFSADANLKNYSALVFSNSNNEAFSSDAQRDAFKQLHRSPAEASSASTPASGSEREWPYFWSVLGGKFAAHPRMQSFTGAGCRSRVFPLMKSLPAQFEWTDECYFIDHLNP